MMIDDDVFEEFIASKIDGFVEQLLRYILSTSHIMPLPQTWTHDCPGPGVDCVSRMLTAVGSELIFTELCSSQH